MSLELFQQRENLIIKHLLTANEMGSKKRKTREKKDSQSRDKELERQLILYDCKMRDEDRRMLSNINVQTFQYIFKLIMTVSAIGLGGSAFINLPKVANKILLILSWVSFSLAIAAVSIELLISHHKTDVYIAELAKNEGYPAAPNNFVLKTLAGTALFFMLMGLVFIVSAMAKGNP